MIKLDPGSGNKNVHQVLVGWKMNIGTHQVSNIYVEELVKLKQSMLLEDKYFFTDKIYFCSNQV